MTLAERIAERIRREGPITFADFHGAALYDEHDGFFSSGRGAGAPGATSSPAPRSERCSARSSVGSSTPRGSGWANPIRSS